MALFLALVSILVLRNRNKPRKMRHVIPPGVFHDLPFLLCTGALFLLVIAYYIPSVYLGSFSLLNGVTSPELAFYLVPILQAGNIAGRLLAYFADWTGPVNFTIPAVLFASILVFAWIRIHNASGLIIFAILYGICAGIISALLAGCVASYFGV